MAFPVSNLKEHLIGMSHSGTLNRVRNFEALLERAVGTFLLKCHPLDNIRTAALSSTIHDDVYNYTLPSDFGFLIDLIPQDDRDSWDRAFRNDAVQFDLEKAIKNRTVSIEGSEGVKVIRINWRSRTPKTINTMNSLTLNGTWAVTAAGASGILRDTIFKKSGGASIQFDLTATGGGIQNTTMTAVDLTDEDEVSNVYYWIYFPTVPTSTTIIWGNDLTTNYWTGVAQTAQADGSAFRIGWNLIRTPWSTATETGTVAPATVDSVRVTVANAAAINNIRVDNITVSIGRNFDIKYHSKYLITNAAGTTWLSRTTSDDDLLVLDNDSLPMFLHETLIEIAQQIEGADSTFDMNYALGRLKELYPAYKGINPSMVQKVRRNYGPSIARGRW